jgi:hypothetical protein
MSFIVSHDGYIRCSYSTLVEAGLTHLISGLSGNFIPQSLATSSTEITGYTEWTDSVCQMVSIGWDWEMVGVDKAPYLLRIGVPHSNVMLQTAGETDLSLDGNAAELARFVDGLDWQSQVLQYLTIRYS